MVLNSRCLSIKVRHFRPKFRVHSWHKNHKKMKVALKTSFRHFGIKFIKFQLLLGNSLVKRKQFLVMSHSVLVS